MNYEEAIAYIKNTAKFGSKLGLERTEKILELLGNPHKQIKCIHIAGTNGKGSTTAMISKILIEAGYKVGSYISPYIEEFEERMQINQQNIPKDALSNIVTKVSYVVEKVAEMGYGNPTEFEIITCAGFLYFYEQQVDYAVIEVGIGGRLDSTNVITPILSVITSISLDHTQILGDTLEKIAYEKAGIIKEGVPVVLFPQEAESEGVIEEVCRERNASLSKVIPSCIRNQNSQVVSSTSPAKEEAYTQKFLLTTKKERYDIELSLLGEHQLLNCATAITAIEQLKEQGIKIEKENIVQALRKVKWPGRLEVMRREPLVVIDGAHNIDGIKKLSRSIDLYFRYDNVILILGILADKQVEEMVHTIVPKAKRVIAVTPHSDRAELAEDLKKEIEKIGVQCEAVEDYEEAYKKAVRYCGQEDLLLISGSLYMVGDMRKIIRKNS